MNQNDSEEGIDNQRKERESLSVSMLINTKIFPPSANYSISLQVN